MLHGGRAKKKHFIIIMFVLFQTGFVQYSYDLTPVFSNKALCGNGPPAGSQTTFKLYSDIWRKWTYDKIPRAWRENAVGTILGAP